MTSASSLPDISELGSRDDVAASPFLNQGNDRLSDTLVGIYTHSADSAATRYDEFGIPPSPSPANDFNDHAAAPPLPYPISGDLSQIAGGPVISDIPMRSRLSSPQPTSSLSADTARASMSTVNSYTDSRSRGILSHASALRRNTYRQTEVSTSASMLSFPDYPASAMDRPDGESHAETALDIDMTLPTSSQPVNRSHAMVQSSNTSQPPRMYRGRKRASSKSMTTGVPDLEAHLYHVGFKEGRHSDITIHAFGEQYRLHKLLLERVPFFSSAFSEPWAESAAREMTLRPEEIDSNISKTAFELVLRRIYGKVVASDEEVESIALFAAGCWLDMPDLVNSCVENMLRQMTIENSHQFIKLVTQNCYGKPGDRILASAKAMLCRDGWEMPFSYWDEIPAEILRDVISGDPFYVPDEWARWCLTIKLLNRRLRKFALSEGLISSTGYYLQPKPKSLGSSALRFNNGYDKDLGSRQGSHESWRALYDHVEIIPLLQLLDRGIHYIHLSFEQLQQLRSCKDIFGVLVLPEKVISDAFWMSMELRQLILNANDSDVDLSITETAEDISDLDSDVDSPGLSGSTKGKQSDFTPEEQLRDLGNHFEPSDGRYRRRFWIPSTDVSCVIGGASEAVPSAALTASPETLHRSQRINAGFEASDVAWPPDLGGSIFDSHGVLSRNFINHESPKYSYFPPFRFCAEFPNPRSLKEKKRIYSQTVWYAGSLWNLYIQRVNTSKSQQLGIYLHRAKDKDQSGDPLAVTVDDRIGQLEREMLMRQTGQRRRHRRVEQAAGPNEVDVEDDGTDSSGGQSNSGTASLRRSPQQIRSHRTVTGVGDSHTRSRRSLYKPNDPSLLNGIVIPGHASIRKHTKAGRRSQENEPIAMSDDESEDEFNFLQSATHSGTVSTIPPYVDSRTTINTYFKIYSPSRGGRLLSVYESAPDGFEFGKSWGWLSRHLYLDDGIGDLSQINNGNNKDGKLRYMVVLGNV